MYIVYVIRTNVVLFHLLNSQYIMYLLIPSLDGEYVASSTEQTFSRRSRRNPRIPLDKDLLDRGQLRQLAEISSGIVGTLLHLGDEGEV